MDNEIIGYMTVESSVSTRDIAIEWYQVFNYYGTNLRSFNISKYLYLNIDLNND